MLSMLCESEKQRYSYFDHYSTLALYEVRVPTDRTGHVCLPGDAPHFLNCFDVAPFALTLLW